MCIHLNQNMVILGQQKGCYIQLANVVYVSHILPKQPISVFLDKPKELAESIS